MKSICFCSSQRFREDLEEFMLGLKAEAKKHGARLNIFHPEFEERGIENLPEHERLKNKVYRAEIAGLVYNHLFRKVAIADVCFVYNKDGYIGANTIGELFAAAVLGKTIYSLKKEILMGKYPDNMHEEPSARKLVHDVVYTPKRLFKLLQ